MKKLLTVTEVAKCLAVSRSLVYQLVSQRELPYIPVGKSKAYRFDPEDIIAFILNRKIKAKATATIPRHRRLKHIHL